MLDFYMMEPEEHALFVDGAFEDEPAAPPLYGIEIEDFHALRSCGLAQAFDSANLSFFDDALLSRESLLMLQSALKACVSNKLSEPVESSRASLLEVFQNALSANKSVGVVCD